MNRRRSIMADLTTGGPASPYPHSVTSSARDRLLQLFAEPIRFAGFFKHMRKLTRDPSAQRLDHKDESTL